MAYKYLNTARINTTIKKHGLKVGYTKGEANFHFVDIETGVQVGSTLQIKRMHELTITQWRELAEKTRAEALTEAAARVVETIAA